MEFSEVRCYRNICWIKHPDFQLPGEKELLKNSFKEKTIIINATESPIQRPKKSKKILLKKKEKALIKEQKYQNRLISKVRVAVENIFANLKNSKLFLKNIVIVKKDFV